MLSDSAGFFMAFASFFFLLPFVFFVSIRVFRNGFVRFGDRLAFCWFTCRKVSFLQYHNPSFGNPRRTFPGFAGFCFLRQLIKFHLSSERKTFFSQPEDMDGRAYLDPMLNGDIFPFFFKQMGIFKSAKRQMKVT